MTWDLNRRGVFFGAAAVPLAGSQPIAAEATSSNSQPVFASIKRAIAALAAIGQPVSAADAKLLETFAERQDASAVEAAEKILSKYTLANVTLQSDGYADTVAGAAPKRLVEEGWTAFLVRVANPSGQVAKLNVNGIRTTISTPSTGASRAGVWDTVNLATFVSNIWYRNELYQLPPIGPSLSGAAIDYQVIQIFSRDRGKHEMRLDFWTSTDPMAGAHSASAYRGVHLGFDCVPSSDVALHIRDTDGRACMASLIIKDKLNRVYPFQAMRLEPDMYFQPQIYRADNETVRLPEGEYTIEARR